MRIKTLTLAMLFLAGEITCSCNKSSGTQSPRSGFAGSSPPATPTPQPSTPAAPAYTITAAALTKTELYTNNSSTVDTCTEISFQVRLDGVAAADVTVAFASTGGTNAQTAGTVSPVEMKTNADGNVSTTYCSGEEVSRVAVTAKAGATLANSAEISISKKPVYSFVFSGASVPVKQTAASNTATNGALTDTAASASIQLNLFDSGPNDCAKLYFDLTATSGPVVANTIRFSTQDDVPQGVKLASRDEAGKTLLNATNSRTYAYFDATSSGNGRFEVPICAGFQLGNVLISASYTTPDNVVLKVTSPVIVIQSGITNWANMSLTYARPDGHTLFGYLNTNNEKAHDFSVLLASRKNGDSVADYPIFAAAETGKVNLVDNGKINDATSSAHFTVNSINLKTDRPYQVTSFSTSPSTTSEAITVCDVPTLAQTATSNGSYVKYSDISKNWRSTLVYGTRGQEYYYDYNDDGVYTPGCSGFWDKNQNGIYDTGDVITTKNAAGVLETTFRSNCDWFIDLPSPFIDVDENGAYDLNRDRTVGGAYFAPNGKWDKDTTIWKYDYTPIYMGTSPFALVHSVVRPTGELDNVTDPIGKTYFQNLANKSLLGYGYPPGADKFYLWGEPIDNQVLEISGASSGSAYFYFFAQSICGTPFPGGTKIAVNFVDRYSAAYGDRPLTAYINAQPSDNLREPSRRFLGGSEGLGGSSAEVNFDAVSHPAAEGSFPLLFNITSAPCRNSCKGDIMTGSSGVACDAKEVDVKLLADTEILTVGASIAAFQNCQCVLGATRTGDTCACPSALVSDGSACNAP